MIKEVEGDLIKLALDGEFTHIFHGCNCRGIMGSGIAAQIAKVFPEAAAADLAKYRSNLFPVRNLGDFSHAFGNTTGGRVFYVMNLYTQIEPGANFYLPALQVCLTKIDLILKKNYSYREDKPKLGFPKIGAGIGGGNWEDIRNNIESILGSYDVTIVSYVP